MKKSFAFALLALSATALLVSEGKGYGEEASLKTDKTVYYTSEQIVVRFRAPEGLDENAWIGLIPSYVEHGSEAVNDQHDVSYQYLKKQTRGEFTFTAPSEPGDWDLRMNSSDSDGVELASVSFRVISAGTPPVGEATMNLDKDVFYKGEKIAVHFAAPAGLPKNAWIGIIPSYVEHGSEAENDKYDVTYQYLDGKTSGTLYFTAPEPGAWDFRMNSTDDNGVELTYVSFSVR